VKLLLTFTPATGECPPASSVEGNLQRALAFHNVGYTNKEPTNGKPRSCRRDCQYWHEASDATCAENWYALGISAAAKGARMMRREFIALFGGHGSVAVPSWLATAREVLVEATERLRLRRSSPVWAWICSWLGVRLSHLRSRKWRHEARGALAQLDPTEYGIVTNFARPDGNITGITGLPGVQMFAKRIELLKEAVPSLSRVAVLTSTEKTSLGVRWVH
jgi:hypothetical protein